MNAHLLHREDPAQISANFASTGVRGATNALSNSGLAVLVLAVLLSTLPFGVNGKVSICTKTAGTIFGQLLA